MEASRHRERHLSGFLKGVPVTDGANQQDLRNWLERVQVATELIPGPGFQVEFETRFAAQAQKP